MFPRFLSWPPPPPPVPRPPSTCPECGELATAAELKAYGRCEGCYTNPRVGMPINLAQPKRPTPRK
jgi:hypothetical protein